MISEKLVGLGGAYLTDGAACMAVKGLMGGGEDPPY